MALLRPLAFLLREFASADRIAGTDPNRIGGGRNRTRTCDLFRVKEAL